MEDATVAGQLSARDPDGDAVSFSLVRSVNQGKLTLQQSGSFEFVPNPNFVGTDSFEVTASDGKAVSAPLTVSIDIAPVNDAPTIKVLSDLSIFEDTTALGWIDAADIEGDPLEISVVSAPTHGKVTVLGNGRYEYAPEADFYGEDSFELAVDDGLLSSSGARVTAKVVATDDLPTLPAFSSMTNSPETLRTKLSVPTQDADGERLSITVSSSNPLVAQVNADNASAKITITPEHYGEAQIAVTATDGISSVTREFTFSVEDVTKSRVLRQKAELPSAITISNVSPQSIEFALEHDGNKLQASLDDIVREVQTLPDEQPGELFERKLWRYLRDNVYHFGGLSSQAFVHDPLLLINSLGWGICDDVSTVYMHLARAAGRQSRVWYIWGHVIPEVYVEDDWAMYDPDLAVYFPDDDGKVASVSDLALNPGLLWNADAWLWSDYPNYPTYWNLIADMYSSTQDNYLADDVVPNLVAPMAPQSGKLELPPGATLTYPGVWSAPPTVEGITPALNIPVHANLRIRLQMGWQGSLPLPLQLVEIRGQGTVRLDGIQYPIGSTSLRLHLAHPVTATRQLEVLASASEIELLFLLNPTRFVRGDVDDIHLTGKDVWALKVEETEVTADKALLRSDIYAVSKRKPPPQQ